MNSKLERFRTEALQVGPAKAGRKFPKALMALGAEYATERRAGGASWRQVAEELEVAVLTVQRWCERASATAASFERVAVVDASPRGTYTSSIGALRLEGLDFDAVVALARSLS